MLQDHDQGIGTGGRHLSRRAVLRAVAMGTLGATGLALLQACAVSAPPGSAPVTSAPVPAAAAPTGTPQPANNTTTPATAPAAPPAGVRKGGTVTLGTAQDFPGLDPLIAQTGNTWNLHTLLWSGLTRFDEQMNVQPDLAERWEIPDPRTFVFYLRKGVQFHNGREMTADDVKWTLDRVRNPDTKSSWRTSVDAIQSVDVVDKYTVKVNLSKPNAIQHLDLTYIKIQPKEAVDQIATKPVGTGPYQFTEFVPGDHISLRRFDGYWDNGKPYPDQFTIKIVKDDTSLYNAFKSGQFDIYWQLVPANVQEVSGSDRLYVLAPKVSGNSLGLQVDVGQPPFDNKLARQALLYATDKSTIFDLAYFDVGWPSKTNSALAPTHWAFNSTLNEHPYDIAKAKELFREAGVKDGYTIRYNAISGLFKEWIVQGEILQRSLDQCGIKLDIRPVDLAEWVAVRPATGEKRAWPNVVSPNGVEQGYDPAQQFKEYRSFSSRYNVNYSNPEVDALLDSGLATLDNDERKKIYAKLQDVLSEEVPWVTTHHRPFNHAAWKHIKGVYVDGQGIMHFEGLWTEK